MTSEEILGIQELPEGLLSVGGYIGCEFVAIFVVFGCRVVPVEQQTACLTPTASTVWLFIRRLPSGKKG